MKKTIFTILINLVFCTFLTAQNNVIDLELQNILNQKSEGLIDVNIMFKQQMQSEQLASLNCKSDSKEVRREIVINELQKFAESSQKNVLSLIQAEVGNNNVADIKTHWIANFINCKASRDVIYQLASHPDIELITYNHEMEVVTDMSSVTETRRTANAEIGSHLTQINADKVWDLGYTGKGVIVAVLDSGVNTEHADIKDHLWNGNAQHGYNAANPGSAPTDDANGSGHGTHCAGIICGDGTSGTATGVAPDATLMCIKLYNAGSGMTLNTLIAGIEFAANNGAKILSISQGWKNPSSNRTTIRNTFDNLLQMGVVAAVAAGNDRGDMATLPVPNNVRTPGDCPPPWLNPDQTLQGGLSSVISVGGVNEDNTIGGISSQGPVTWEETSFNDYPYNNGAYMGLIRPDICAPISVKSLANATTGYVIKAGTSQAAPAVAGVMALMLEKNPDLTPADLCRIIETTATKLSQTKSNDFGSGLINALAAVQAVNFNEAVKLNPYSYTKNFNAINANQNLELTLINNGTSTTSGTTNVTLSTNDANITIVNGNASLGTIASNGTATCNFTISVSTFAPDNHKATLTVTTSGVYSATFDIEINISNELVAPSNITTQVQNLTNISLSWEATNNATSYNIYRDGAYLTNTTSTSYLDEGLEYGTLYSFTITTKRNELESEHSQVRRVQTGDNPEAPSPTNVVATVNGNNMDVTWTNATGSESSNVYRKDANGTETKLASDVNGGSYTDNTWSSLPNGIYQYGVSNNHANEENLYNEGFESSTLSTAESTSGWFVYTSGTNWTIKWQILNKSQYGEITPYLGENAAFISNTASNNNYLSYLVTPQFDLTEYNGSKITFSFYYVTPVWSGYPNDINTLNVKISTTSNKGEWTQLWTSNKQDVSEWTKVELDLSAYANSTFYIAFENVIGAGYCTGLDEVSIDIEGSKESRIEWSDNIYKGVNVFAQDGDWNNNGNWGAKQLPTSSDNIIIEANAVINGTVEVNSLTINKGASLTLNEGAKLTVNGDFVNTDADAFIINDGAQVIQNNEDVAATFNMNIINPDEWSVNNISGWQFISSPVKDAEINDFIPKSSDYDLYKYDGDNEMEWVNYKDGSNVDEPDVPTITIDTITAVQGETLNAVVPSNINYDYTISQQIYTVDDLQGKNGKILSYSFQNAKDLAGGNVRNFKIYMKNTTKTSFSGNSDWVSMQESDLVFDGEVTYNSKGAWVTIDFDTPFEYESGKNIILCVYDNKGAWYQSTTNYYGVTTTDKRSIYSYRDDSPYNVSSVGVTGTAITYVGNAKFVFESGGTGGGGGQEPEDPEQPEDPEVPTVPAAPEVTAEAISSSSIKLSWDAVEGATSYKVYSTGYNIATITETNYTVSYLSSNTNYCFTVTAVNEVGESEPGEACATTKMPAPSVPQNLTAEVIDASTISLTWDAVNNATSYNIYQGSSQIATNITETTFNVEDLEEGVEYCFTVTSLNAAGESAKSSSACATPATDDRCVVEFILKDSYSDTWSGNYLLVSYGGTSTQLTLDESVAEKTYTLKIPSGTTVTVQYVKGAGNYTYPTENSWTIQYEGGEVIQTGTGTTQGSTNSFVTNCGTGGGGGQDPDVEPENVTVEIGADAGNSSYWVPFCDYYGYFISQQIYTKDEIGQGECMINSVSFKIGSGTAETRQYEVYMKNTDQSSFSGTSYIAMSASDKVFDGNVEVGTAGTWCTIQFTTPFNYTGNNVVLCVYDKSGKRATGYHAFYKFSASGRSLYSQGSNAYSITSLTSGSTRSYVNQVQFEMTVNDAAAKGAVLKNRLQTTDNGQYPIVKNYTRGSFETTFAQGVGYMASYEKEQTATFKGNLNHEKSYDFKVSYNADKNFANFHLLGNPFSFNMNWENVITNDMAEGYAVVTAAGGYQYGTDGEIKVGDGFFVKAIGENPSVSYGKRAQRKTDANMINVIASNGAGQDNVIIKLDDSREGFPKLKNFNENIANIFVSENEQRYGIYNCSTETQEVGLAFEAKQMGNYSIIIDTKGEFDKIILLDKSENVEFDMLLNNEYKFFSTNGINDRFVLKFSLKGGDEQDENFVYQSGDELIINADGNIQIFDVMGRLVYSNDVENQRRINVSNFNNAAYIVRCISDNNVKTQKIVIL